MARAAFIMNEPDLSENIARLAPDLAFLLEDKGVARILQGQIASAGFANVPLFALMADDRPGLRDLLKDEPFNLDPAADGAEPGAKVKRRMAVAHITTAWEAAGCRVSERNKADAEKRAPGLPLTLPCGDHVEMRRVFEA